MPETRPAGMILAGIAVLGIGLIAFTDVTTGSRSAIGLAPDTQQSLGWASKRTFVELPKPTNSQSLAGLPCPTAAPPLSGAEEQARRSEVVIEALPTEDPYAG